MALEKFNKRAQNNPSGVAPGKITDPDVARDHKVLEEIDIWRIPTDENGIIWAGGKRWVRDGKNNKIRLLPAYCKNVNPLKTDYKPVEPFGLKLVQIPNQPGRGKTTEYYKSKKVYCDANNVPLVDNPDSPKFNKPKLVCFPYWEAQVVRNKGIREGVQRRQTEKQRLAHEKAAKKRKHVNQLMKLMNVPELQKQFADELPEHQRNTWFDEKGDPKPEFAMPFVLYIAQRVIASEQFRERFLQQALLEGMDDPLGYIYQISRLIAQPIQNMSVIIDTGKTVELNVFCDEQDDELEMIDGEATVIEEDDEQAEA